MTRLVVDFTGNGASGYVKTVPGQRYIFVFAAGALGTGVLRPEESFEGFDAVFPLFKETGDQDPLEFDLTTTKAGRVLYMAGCDRFRFVIESGASGAQSDSRHSRASSRS